MAYTWMFFYQLRIPHPSPADEKVRVRCECAIVSMTLRSHIRHLTPSIRESEWGHPVSSHPIWPVKCITINNFNLSYVCMTFCFHRIHMRSDTDRNRPCSDMLQLLDICETESDIHFDLRVPSKTTIQIYSAKARDGPSLHWYFNQLRRHLANWMQQNHTYNPIDWLCWLVFLLQRLVGSHGVRTVRQKYKLARSLHTNEQVTCLHTNVPVTCLYTNLPVTCLYTNEPVTCFLCWWYLKVTINYVRVGHSFTILQD